MTAPRVESGVPARLAGFAVALVVVFAAAFLVAGAVVPDSTVTRWEHRVAHDSDTGGGH